MKQSHIVILVTAKDKKEAQKISRALLKDQLIACANMVSGVESLFWWQDKIDTAKETLIILKTKTSLFKRVLTRIKFLHSYKNPEIIALPVIDGSKDYLKWISSSVM